MATIPFEVLPVKDPAGATMAGANLVRWPAANSGFAAVTSADTCAPYLGGNYADKSMQVIGTLGTSWGVEGTNDPTLTAGSFVDLRDPQGSELTGITALDVRSILDNTYAIRPKTPVGGTASHTYLLLVQSPARRS